MNVTDEQRKRREFLYHIYRGAQHSNSQGGFFPVNCAYTMMVYQDMHRNWGFLSNAGGAPLLYYHLAEGNISITTPYPDGVDIDTLSDDAWKYGPDSIFPERIFITSKGINTVEDDYELLACLIFDGAAVDWSKIETAVPKQPESTVPTTLTLPQVGGLSKLISKWFSKGELRDLSLYLSLDYENLPSDTKNGMARELVNQARRENKVPRLWAKLHEERPHVDWSQALVK